MTLYIFRGLPGSGKSTRARKMQSTMGGRVVERDAVRFMLSGRYTNCDEKLVTEVQNTLIDQGLRMQENVFVSDMNLRNQYVVRLIQKAQAFGQPWEIVDMTDASVFNCKLRNESQERRDAGKQVPEEVIDTNYQKFIKGRGFPLPVMFTGAMVEHTKTVRVPYVADKYKPNAIIVDIDGTLAEMTDRGPFDEHLVKNDRLFENVAKMVEHAVTSGCFVIFMSGRTDGCEDDTADWLMEKMPFMIGNHTFIDWDLLMRRSVEDRGRPDDDVKYDLFNTHVRDKFNVLYVIDDRDKVVKMWRDIGLTCAQVAYGDF